MSVTRERFDAARTAREQQRTLIVRRPFVDLSLFRSTPLTCTYTL